MLSPATPSSVLARTGLAFAFGLAALAALSGCGGGGASPANPPPPVASPPPPPAPAPAPTPAPPTPNPLLTLGDSNNFQTLLSAAAVQPAPAVPSTPGVASTTLVVHYKRAAADYSGWQLHAFNAAKDPGWNAGYNASSIDAFGAVYDVPLGAQSGTVGYLFHKMDEKDHAGADQSYVLKPGKNEIWRIQGDSSTYNANPSGAAAPDLRTVRVHYLRYKTDYANWGLHLWPSNGIDVSRLAAGTKLDDWPNAVGFDKMPGFAASASEVVFDIPVLNPKDDPKRKTLEFIIHGKAPNENDKDGRAENIVVDYAGLNIRAQVAEIWLVQQDAQIYPAAPDLRRVSVTDSRAVWLSRQLLQWPNTNAAGVVKLYHSATGQLVVPKDGVVSGFDGALTLDASSAAVPQALATRFKWVAPGAVFGVKAADLAQLPMLHKSQLVLVQEDATGKVQNATTVQNAGALDDLYAAGANVPDLGVTVAGGNTRFKLWAPTAQRVLVFTHDTSTSAASTVDVMAFDAATGVWSTTRTGDLSGKYYRFAVEVFVRGTGVVRNLVTDPYSLSLSANSARSFIADLNSPALKPAGWDASTPPPKVAGAPDMSIYELHVRDFSANDGSVSAANRGKYMAFSDAGSNGMKHLKALGDAGLTDVHLLPAFDFASVNETNCLSPAFLAAAPDADIQQAAVAAAASTDCYNWGYDPLHYTSPDGSYASDATDGAVRIREFRSMVKGLHDAGLRVGMDVVYNHTSASGQNAKSVLDRIVPGYYHRLNATGGVENSTCCDNTATENLMMGKLMTDSVVTWARDYKISSLRFDIMGHQPRSVMEAMKAKLKTATGRDIQLLGEGWNFGEVADGARFVQATLYSLNGSGIGTFNPYVRDAVRGGSPFDSGDALIANQGWINGLYFDPNAKAPTRGKNDLMWSGDVIKAALAGSIRSYALKTHWDATVRLEELQVGGQPVGYVLEPSEVVNYVENHDNQTLFDNNAMRLPQGTSKSDRARVQILGAAVVALSQGTPYFHAGIDTLRSKSLDRNSYDAGDWFNRLDWTYADNYFGMGLPGSRDNADNWPVMKPILANAANIKPAATDIAWTRDAFRDLLKIRASTSLLRLRTADDIKQRLTFHNTGSAQVATVLVGQIAGEGYAGANFRELVYVINADKVTQTVSADALKGKALVLHPVHTATGAADTRAAASTYSAATGSFVVPARTAVVFAVK